MSRLNGPSNIQKMPQHVIMALSPVKSSTLAKHIKFCKAQ